MGRMIVDVHTHAFPDDLAARALPALEAEADWKAYLDGTVGDLLASMDRNGVDLACVCMIATKPAQNQGILDFCEQIRSDRLEPFPSIHPDTPEPARWVARFVEAGFRGLKLHPMYQAFAADEERVMPIYRAAAEAGLPVTLHCGRDVAYPPGDDRASPRRMRRLLDEVPGLKLIATHMGGWRMWQEVDRLLTGTDCWMETSVTFSQLPCSRVVDMIRRHGTGRVLFGTDSPWSGHAGELERLRSSGLTEDELAGILGGNAAKLLGLER
jgi:hypothetical protein